MTCKRAQSLYSSCWDDELSVAEREALGSHFQGCSSCRLAYDEWARTLELVQSLPRLEAPAGFPDRVLAVARAREAATPPGWRERWAERLTAWRESPAFRFQLAGGAMAAAAAVAVVVLIDGSGPERVPAVLEVADRDGVVSPMEKPSPAEERVAPPASEAEPVPAETRAVAKHEEADAGPALAVTPKPERSEPEFRSRPLEGLAASGAAKAPEPEAALYDSLFDERYEFEFALDPVHLQGAPGDSGRPVQPTPHSEYGRRASIHF